MHKIQLNSRFSRERACGLVMQAPEGWTVTLAQPTRTTDQSAKMWAMLTDLSIAKPEGRRLIAEDWKVLMMHACGWECQFLEGLDGRPFPKGFSSSRLTKAQMGDLINFIQEYGDRHGVRWSDEAREAA
jgi:hypothetical protein